MICGIYAIKICYYFFIGKIYSIDNYEMTNIFNMLDYLSANINYVYKHRNLKGSGT